MGRARTEYTGVRGNIKRLSDVVGGLKEVIQLADSSGLVLVAAEVLIITLIIYNILGHMVNFSTTTKVSNLILDTALRVNDLLNYVKRVNAGLPITSTPRLNVIAYSLFEVCGLLGGRITGMYEYLKPFKTYDTVLKVPNPAALNVYEITPFALPAARQPLVRWTAYSWSDPRPNTLVSNL